LKIEKVSARRILDSRGNPTIEVEVKTNKIIGLAAVSSGASTGIHEACELRDNTKKYLGKDVQKAIDNVNKKINQRLKGLRLDDQKVIDEAMIDLDGTQNKKNLGANAILGVSMATARASAISMNKHLYDYLSDIKKNKNLFLPVPFANVLNGGVHAGNELNFQEFMIAPIGAKSFGEATRMVAETYQELKAILKDSYGKSATNVGDEGGFAPNLKTPEEALDLLETATEELGYDKKIRFSTDVAASEYFDKKTGMYKLLRKPMSGPDMIDYYKNLIKSYKLISIEDPFAEDDFVNFRELTLKIGNKIQVVGDDLTVSNTKRIQKAIDEKMCNALLLKVNQIGTVTEAIDAADLAMKNKWKVMVSHRSGETEDPFIADLSVGIGCGQIKLCAPARGERTAKYNQLLRIEEYLGKKAKYSKFK